MFSEKNAKAGVTFPTGFKAAGVRAGIKKSGNLDLALGTQRRYTEKLMLNRFTDSKQFTVIGSANNIGDRGFGGGGGRGADRGL